MHAQSTPAIRTGDVILVPVGAAYGYRAAFRVRVETLRPVDYRGLQIVAGTLVKADGTDRKGSPERHTEIKPDLCTVIVPAPVTEAELTDAYADDAAWERVITRCSCDPSTVGCGHPDCKGVPPITLATHAQPMADDRPSPAEYGTQTLARTMRDTFRAYPGLDCPDMPTVATAPRSNRERSVCVTAATVNGRTVHVVQWEDARYRPITSVLVNGRLVNADVLDGRGVTEQERANMVAWRVSDAVRDQAPVTFAEHPAVDRARAVVRDQVQATVAAQDADDQADATDTREEWEVRSDAFGGTPCADTRPHAAHTLDNAPRGVARPVVFRCAGVEDSTDQASGDDAWLAEACGPTTTDVSGLVTVHTWSGQYDTDEDLYTATQVLDAIGDGDVLVLPSAGIVGFVYRTAYPAAVTLAYGGLHPLTTDQEAWQADARRYADSIATAVGIARAHGWELAPGFDDGGDQGNGGTGPDTPDTASDGPSGASADQAEAATVRMDYGTRSAIRESAPDRPGNGTSRHWTRTINGRPYSFTAVLMPNGERRYEVTGYNGYCADADGRPTENALKFGCAWSPVHFITVPAPGDGGDQGNGGTRPTGPDAAPDGPSGASVDQAEPVWIEHPADVMAEARTLRAGDHVSGRTSDRRYFAGYLCADPAEGRDRHGNHAIVIMLASAPVAGKGAPWCITRTARFARLPIDPAVTAEGETMTAIYAMRAAGYTVAADLCGDTAAHHPHIYRRPGATARMRFACRGRLTDADQTTTEAATVTVPDQATEATPALTREAVIDALARGVSAAVDKISTESEAPMSEPTTDQATTESEAPMSDQATDQTTTEAAPATVPDQADAAPTGRLSATVDRAALIEALTYAAKMVPARSLPAFAAVTLTADQSNDTLRVDTHGYDAYLSATVGGAAVTAPGSVMADAKALLASVKAIPAPKGRNAPDVRVRIVADGAQVTVSAGTVALSADVFTSDIVLHPAPTVPATAVMTAAATVFAASVAAVAEAAGRDDTLPVLMHALVTTTERGDTLNMLTTDSYRAAEAAMPVTYRLPADTDAREHVTPGLVSARMLALVGTVAAKTSATSVDMVSFGHGGDDWHGYRAGRFTFAVRLYQGVFPRVREAILDAVKPSHLVTDAVALAAMVTRVATGAGKADPVRLTVTSDATGEVAALTATLIKDGKEAARQTMPATGRVDQGFTFGCNPKYFASALAPITGTARIGISGERQALIVTGDLVTWYRAAVQPVRIDGAAVTAEAPAPVVDQAEAVTEAAPVPVDVRTAEETAAASDAGQTVRVHGSNGHGDPAVLSGLVASITTVTRGRMSGTARVHLDNGRTIYVPVTATTKGDTVSTTDQTTTDQTTLVVNAATRDQAERTAHRAFQAMTGGDYAAARAFMTEAATVAPVDYRYGDRFTLADIMVMIDQAEARATEAAPVDQATEAAPVPAPVDEAAPVDPSTVRAILSRATWSPGRDAGTLVYVLSLNETGRLSRPTYLAVADVVKSLGGAWNKRVKGFAFAAPVQVWPSGRYTSSGADRLTAWLAGDDAPAATEAAPIDQAEATEAAPSVSEATDQATDQGGDQADALAAVTAHTVDPSTAIDQAYRAGYEAALATLTGGSAPVPATVPTAEPVPADGATFAFAAWSVTGVAYNDARVRVAAAIESDGIAGVTVDKKAKKGPDRSKIKVSAPSAVRARVYAIVAREIKAMAEAAPVKA